MIISKKTGNIITAVVLGLLLLWLTQHVFAQSPELEECGHVYVDSYDDSDLNISAIEGVTVTLTNPENLYAPYPAYATVGPVSWEVNGQDKSGVPLSLYFEKPIYPNGVTGTVVITTAFGAWNSGNTLNGFVLISSTGYYLPDTAGVTVSATQEFVQSNLWQIGPNWLQSELYGTLMQERFEFSGITGDVIGVKIVAGNRWGDNTEVYVGRWEAEGWCVPEQGGGPITCTTVTDADFTNPIPFEDGGWLVEQGVTIHDGYLDLAGESAFYSQSQITATQRTYTVTMYARSATSQTALIDVGIVGDSLDGDVTPVDVTETVNDDFGVYTFTITNTVSAGENAYLFVGSLDSGDNPAQIDYICLQQGNGVCANPSELEYIYSKGNDVNDLSLWVPTLIDESIDTPTLKDYPITWALQNLPGNGGYKQFASELSTFSPQQMLSLILGVFNLATGSIPDNNFFEYFEGAPAGLINSMALKAPVMGQIESIEIDYVTNENVYDVNFSVLAGNGDEYTVVGSKTITTTDDFDYQNGQFDYGTINIPLDVVNQPSEYILLSSIRGTSGPGLFQYPVGFVTKITTYGCYQGSYYNSECLVSDPDLNGGDNGPDDYYWDWSPEVAVISGSVTLAAENLGQLSQNVVAEAPGQYDLQIWLDSTNIDRCELFALGTATDGLTDLWSVAIPCTSGIYSQTVTAKVNIPAQPFKFTLASNRGTNIIHRVCFGLPGLGCINYNSDFTDGLNYYSGGEQLAGGGVLLTPGTALQAIGVPYYDRPFYSGSYVLTVQGDIFTNSNVTSGAVNTYILSPSSTGSPVLSDTHQTISQATTISYTMATRPESDLGPSVWNWDNPAGESLRLTNYCITTNTNKLWYGDKTCTTVTNPDFLQGLTGWTSANVLDTASWVKFATAGGYVKQSISMDNMVANGRFDTGISGWLTHWGDTLSNDAGGYSGNGLKMVGAGAAVVGARYSVATQASTNYAFFARVKVDPTVTGTVYIGLHSTAFEVIARQMVTADGAWHNYTNSGNSASNTALFMMVICGSCKTGDVIYVDDVAVVQGSSIPLQYTSPQSATVHIIGKSPDNLDLSATVSVSSTAGVFTTTQSFGNSYLADEYFIPFNVGGDVELMVAGDQLLEIDYICLINGEYDGEGDNGGGGGIDGPGSMKEWSEVCGSPPMLIVTNTLESWMPGIWPTLQAPDNLTQISAYTAMNVRYIACFITGWAQMMQYQLDTIIALLREIRTQLLIGNILTALGILVLIVQLVLGSSGEIAETIAALAPLLAGGVGSIASLLALIPGLIAFIALVVLLVTVMINIGPVFFRTLSAAMVGTEGMTLIPDTANQVVLGYIIAGLQIFDTAAGQTYLMPFVALVIAIGTIGLLIWTVNKIGGWSTK